MKITETEFRYESMLDEYPDTVISFGAGATNQFLGMLLGKQISSVLIFAGGSVSGSLNRSLPDILALLCENQIEAYDWRGIPPEPAVEDVRKMRDAIEKIRPQVVAAVGGGSVMDAAKAAYLSWQTGMDVTELFGVNRASEKFPDKVFERVVCIPTTAGTGSEVTPYANIVDSASGVKKLIMEKAIIPAYAFVYPKYSSTMPRRLTVSTALDALVHCVESVLNVRAADAHPDSVNWGIRGIRLIAAGLPAVLKQPEHELGRTFLAAAATSRAR